MTLHYEESGDMNAEPIIYLHGAGMAGWSWHDVTSLLPQYRNIVVDLPAHGGSNTIEANTVADMAFHVAELIADITPEAKAHLVGISLGGMTTVRLLENHPDSVISAVISGVNAIPLPLSAKVMTRMMIPFIKNNFLIRQNAKMFQLDDEASKLYFKSMKQFNLKTFNKLLSEVLNFVPADQFHGINNPTLFVAGSNEQPINIESVSLMANAMNNAVGTIAPDVNHGWSGENPYLFADMIEQWVSKQAVATGLELVVDKRQQVMLT